MVATLPPVALFSSAAFTYDADTLRGTSGKRVKSALTTNVGTTDTYFIGNYYEVTGGVATKYYYAGTQRIALRKNGALMFILGDHLGSTSLVTDSTGAVINQTQYKAWGEERYSSGAKQTNYGYTGQCSYESDFGLHFYNARWYDSSLGRFAQADSIVPAGVQGYDRYAAMENNPVRYTDPISLFMIEFYKKTMERKKIISLLKRNKRQLKKFGVCSMSVFGSVARDQIKKRSDIDLLVEFSKPIGLFEFARLKVHLEGLLGRKVDLVTPQALRKELREDILQEAIHAI